MRSNPAASRETSSIGERFLVLGELGRGGMSVVLLVEDRLRGQRLALKRMQRTEAVDIRRLKREYRAIERITHPNIVSVLELGIDAEGPYFLMEVVDGVDLRRWCRGRAPGESFSGPAALDEVAHDVKRSTTLTLDRPGPVSPDASGGSAAAADPLSETRLAKLFDALPQIVAALECLHDSGLVHRDLKPANVLVRSDGVLKLLDFGILGETGFSLPGVMQGTAGYVAPEQIGGEAPAPANDLYSLGAMLFEVVTGHLPFPGASRQDVLLAHVHVDAVPVRALAPDCPPWLEGLIAGLLRKRPGERPGLREIKALCAAHAPRPDAAVPTMAPLELVERGDEQQALLDVLDQADQRAFRFVALCGASGLGKSALLAWARGAVRRRQLTVFESRTRFSERVSFNAIDGLVDDLAAMIERFPEMVEDSDGRALRESASAAFPVLLRSPSGARASVDPRETFDALVVLLQRCARVTGRLVLLCDDLQWADADSVSLLTRLVAIAPDDVLVIAAVRDDTHTDAFARFWSRFTPHVRVALRPLSEGALAQIIEGVAADAGHPIDETRARHAASACEGRPLLAVISGRVATNASGGAALHPISWLLEHYAGPASLERRVLLLLAAIDGDTPLETIGRLAGMTAGSVDEVLSPLVRERLVLAAGRFGEGRTYDFNHDLIRRTVLELVTPDEVRDAHAHVADDLDRTGGRGAQLVRHLLGAGRLQRAAEVAETAAREALASNAFGLAVDLYQVAIQHGAGTTDSLREARAVALERSGRYLDASAEWARLAEQRTGESRVDALLQKAKALLATDHITEGRRALEEARRERRERSLLPEGLANLVAATRFLAGPWAVPGRRVAGAGRPSTPADERDVFLGTMVGYFEPLAGIRLMLQARHSYRKAGNRIQSAEIDYVLSYLGLWLSRRQGETSLSERYARSARRALGGEARPEHGRPYALDLMIQGIHALHGGRWQAAAAGLDAAIAFYASSGRKGSFEHLFCFINRQYVDRFRQDVRAWSATLDRAQPEMEAGQDSALRCGLGFARSRCALLRGELEESLRIGRQTRDSWPQDEPSLQRYFSQFYLLMPQVYLSDGVQARLELQQIVRSHARFMPMRSMVGAELIGHSAFFEAAAIHKGVRDASPRRVMRWARLAEQACPIDRHLAMRAAAYTADYCGAPERAVSLLERAERAAEQFDQRIDIAIARYQRGLRLLGSQGAALMRDAENLVEQAGAHVMLLREDPARR